jgi:hypothetical protein
MTTTPSGFWGPFHPRKRTKMKMKMKKISSALPTKTSPPLR